MYETKERILFNIQLFAEDGASEGDTDGSEQQPTGASEEGTQSEGKQKSELKYTDEDVNRLIKQKHAEWNKKQEQKESEAERLAKMSAEEKINERVQTLEDELAEYKAREAKAEMMAQARALMQDKGLSVKDSILSNLIADDAETTKANCEAFADLMKKAVEDGVTERLKGSNTVPKTGKSSGLTKEQILSIPNRAERQAMIRQNPHLF